MDFQKDEGIFRKYKHIFNTYEDFFNRDNYPKFSAKSYLPIDEEVCVCLMGKQYKDCCKTKHKEAIKFRKENPGVIEEELDQFYLQKDSKLISSKVEKASVNKKNIAYCSAHEVFGDCDHGNHMRHSHTLTENNVLRNLSFGDKVIGFNDHKVPNEDALNKDISMFYSEIPIENASVTVSFCKKHDEELFADIEKDGNTDYSGTSIQNIEYSLKAITFDIYYKIMNIFYMAELIRNNKYAICSPDGSQSEYFRNYHHSVETLFRLYPLMLKMLNELKRLKTQEAESKLETIIFELPIERINLSLSEVIEYEDILCFVNVINSKKPYIIVSYYKESKRIISIDKLKKMYDSCENEKLQLWYLWNFIKELLINSINIYFNKTAFYDLSDEAKVYLYIVHREGIADIPPEWQNFHDIELMRFLYGCNIML
ncbi:hypothetical protein [Paenibacillus radicis (ex Gao et al. 2016)]|uniref:SEC-C domain-containing protein n=1 Tax=Paenibacillus radicis (ex Gao et al. 2016) TaxID=1737354 RepID=A0A917HB00_9BACL|nr:hypothetical protein [Paenibacillus radicis (ex Gao et al. 2016)]GGG73407.1 hypothetical protein GCM10010918_31860 [Paenibacillus radicis (ex Gao et al. 2016)]